MTVISPNIQLFPESDETVIEVLTPLGILAGAFCFPTSCLDMLEAIEKSDRGYHMRPRIKAKKI